MPEVLAPAVVLVAGGAALTLLTLRWVPAQPAPEVSAADVDRDFSAEEQARERAFRRAIRPWGIALVALDVLVPTVLVLAGVVSRVAGSAPGSWWSAVVLATSVVLVVTRLATLPCAVVVRRHTLDAGLATGSWTLWTRDVVLAFLLGWLLACVALVGWVAAVRAWPEAWWIVVALVAAVLVVVLSFLVPVVVEPMFARFVPMADGPLRTRLLELATRDGVVVGDVLVADASRRSNALNAYVSGLGSTRRVVVHDTLLDRGRDDEVPAVVAHELGHVVAHDVRTGTVLGAGGAVLAVAAATVMLAWEPLLDLVHVTTPSDPAVAGFLLVAGAWAGVVGAPVQSAVSRRVERRADQHCLTLTDDPATVAEMHRALAVTNLASLRPPRLLHLWFGTHPTSPQRIAAARTWARSHGGSAVPDLVGPEEHDRHERGDEQRP